MNSSFDQELRRALARVEPPNGFAERLLENIPERRQRRVVWYGAVAAGLALLFTVGGIEQNRHEQRRRAQQTGRQIMFALSLAAEKIDHVNARLQKSAPELRFDKQVETQGERL